MNEPFFQNLPLAQLPVLGSSQPLWLTNLRKEASHRICSEGLPTKKTESWQFTSLRGMLNIPFVPAKAVRTSDSDWSTLVQWAKEHLGKDDTDRLFVINGIPLTLRGDLQGVDVHRLSLMLASNPAAIEPYLARHAQGPIFGALNSALFSDGLSIRVPENSSPERPLHIVHISVPGTEPTSCYPRLSVIADSRAKLSLVETYLTYPGAKDFCNAVTEVVLHPGSHVTHTRVVEGAQEGYHLGTVAVHQQRDSHYTSCSIVMGGRLCRVDIDVRLAEPGAECTLDGVYHAIGNEHVDHNTRITHAASHCTSNEEYRGLVADRGHAVFDGTIVVDRDAQHSSVQQQNHNLLLSDDATVNTKPHLEIDADDITASHGATVGALDPSQLFYLRSRGIGENDARALLTFSFLRSIVDRVQPSLVRERLLKRCADRLPDGKSLMESGL